MALFGEKYGDWVRMVEIEDVSRELCGGTHTATTAEVGLFHVTTETSSASNVRRIEALTGPAGVALFRERSEALREIAALLRTPEADVVRAVEKADERLRELKKKPAGATTDVAAAADELVGQAEESGGPAGGGLRPPMSRSRMRCWPSSDTVRQRLGDAAVVLGSVADGRVNLVATFSDAAVAAGARADEVVRAAAAEVGGGGGGRETMARAGGKDPDKLPEALARARAEIEKALA